MADPLSLAASVFAVVGAVDVALRASVEISRFLADIKDAPAEVDNLRTSLRENTVLLETSKHYLQDLTHYASSANGSLGATRLNEALTLFTSATKALEREIKSLQALARKHNGVSKSWGRIKFILDERKVSKSVLRLESSRSALTFALVLVSRRESALAGKAFEIGVEQNFQKVMSGTSAALALINDNHMKHMSRQDEIVRGTNRQHTELVRLRKDVYHVRHVSRREHSLTRKHITQGYSNLDTTIRTGFEDIQNMVSKIAEIAKQSDRVIAFVGQQRAAVLLPLLLLETPLRSAILETLSDRTSQATSACLGWLRSEVENLLASAAQEVAALSPRSTASSFDTWTYQEGSTIFSRTRRLHTRDVPGLSCESRPEIKSPTQSSPRVPSPKRRPRVQWSVFSGPAGQLRLVLPHSRDSRTHGEDSDEVGFCFFPPIQICTTAIAARFVKVTDLGCAPKLYAQLNAFTIVEGYENNYESVSLFYRGSLREIDDALRDGTISPYHIDERGKLQCLLLATTFGRTDVLRYFDCHGIGPASLNDSFSMLQGYCVAVDNDLRANTKQTTSIQDYVTEKLADLDLPSPDSAALYFCYLTGPGDRPDDFIKFARRYWKFLDAEGFNVDEPSNQNDGLTPLLLYVLRVDGRSIPTIDLLLEFGANIHATDKNGHNALHIALNPDNHELEDLPQHLEEKLIILIKAGADVHRRNNQGATPSCFARFQSCFWIQWCRALERNGLDINEVLQVDDEEWILESWMSENGEWKIGAAKDEAADDEAGKDDTGAETSDGGSCRLHPFSALSNGTQEFRFLPDVPGTLRPISEHRRNSL